MSTQSVLFDVAGEHPTDPELRVQPTAQRATPTANVGWKWRRRYTLTNTGAEAVANHPFAINIGATNGLVSGSKALSSGNDLRVWIGGREVARSLNTWNSATDCLVWIVIPYLAAGGTLLVEIVYGNASAGAPPTLTAGADLPAFDIAATGGSRSTNVFWKYLTERIAANAGKGGWYVSSGTAEPDARFHIPGAWQLVNTRPSDDDRRQQRYATYTDSGTKYHARFEARRARGGTMALTEDDGTDGVSLRVPTGIASVRADIRWQNLAVGDTNTTPVGRVVILTRNSESDDWKTLYSNGALQASEATIATATYTPAAAVREIAFAVWPQDGIAIDPAARADRYVNAAWFTTLEVNLTASVITQTTTQAETEVYELATELRYGGGGDATPVPPYKSIYLGNAKSASGVGTPRLACKIDEQIVVKTETRAVEVWNSGLTAKVEDVPIGAVSAVDGVLTAAGTVEQHSVDWMPFIPTVNPLTNPSADVDTAGWVQGALTSGLSVGAISRITSSPSPDTAPGAFQQIILGNTHGAGAESELIASDYLPVGDRQSVCLGIATQFANNVNRRNLLSIWWYNAQQSQIAKSVEPEFSGTLNVWLRRLFAAAIPDGAVYYRVGITGRLTSALTSGSFQWDTVAVNAPEVALRDVNIGAITLSARWQDRYAYA